MRVAAEPYGNVRCGGGRRLRESFRGAEEVAQAKKIATSVLVSVTNRPKATNCCPQ